MGVDFRGEAAGGWAHFVRLQHPKGVDPPLGPTSPRWLLNGAERYRRSAPNDGVTSATISCVTLATISSLFRTFSRRNFYVFVSWIGECVIQRVFYSFVHSVYV